MNLIRWRWYGALFALALVALPAGARAEDKVGAHFGVVFPLVTRANGKSTTISDEFNVGFPTGITIKPGGRFAFDLELVPLIHSKGKRVDLTVHPGVLYSLGGPWTAGLRAAFDVNARSYGFTPLLNLGFPQANGTTFFGELVLPVRFQQNDANQGQTAVTVGLHFGWAF
ncbi:MAG TPA: hypothetical protein VGR07_06690 [Thermoanaerobaculia bacterium]|jgi:hypothetical protein|nr:hypothetical protein [Thermoanaerobaculia bacterium]